MNLKTAFKVFIKPVESTRYIEFSYLLKFLKKNKIKNEGKALDISSPFIMAYLMSEKFQVLKTDINEKEKINIKESHKLKFKKEDATKLSFKDNSFDLVFSISVIEHIYKNYITAIIEMIRVTKPDGIIYLTFPVSNRFMEEWLDSDIYSSQYKEGEKTFFQYRFDENKVNEIFDKLTSVQVLSKDIFWERKNGQYDRIIEMLKKYPGNKLFNYLINSLINLYAGFSLMKSVPEDFKVNRSFGNISIILKKI